MKALHLLVQRVAPFKLSTTVWPAVVERIMVMCTHPFCAVAAGGCALHLNLRCLQHVMPAAHATRELHCSLVCLVLIHIPVYLHGTYVHLLVHEQVPHAA